MSFSDLDRGFRLPLGQSLVCVLTLAFAAASCFAQEFRATLTGRVTDVQGAVVPAAKISVVDLESQAKTETVSGLCG